jgi:hypothetical protein
MFKVSILRTSLSTSGLVSMRCRELRGKSFTLPNTALA